MLFYAVNIYVTKHKIDNMNNLKIKGNWNELKGKLMKEYAVLTDNDLAFEKGQEDEMLGRIQQKTGKAREELKKMIFEQ
jgi:uncharacterized protein YjbJ (UPF0337 family)